MLAVRDALDQLIELIASAFLAPIAARILPSAVADPPAVVPGSRAFLLAMDSQPLSVR